MSNGLFSKEEKDALIKSMIGLPFKEAKKALAEHNMTARIVGIGTESFMRTADFRDNRVNFVLSDKGLSFKTIRNEFDFDGEKIVTERKEYENKEDGIVESAHVG